MSNFPGSIEEIAGRVIAVRARRGALRPVGGAAQLHIGEPVLPDAEPLPLRGLAGIVDFAPEDMVVTVRAGTTLSELQETLSASGQWLPIECAHPDTQTIGGIVAARAPTLCRAGYGSIRDWLIGLEAVGGDGQIIRGGGRVVKNVSGYDLPKLYCGSWGTLGVITQINFKVAPRPEGRCTLLAMLSPGRNSEEAIDALLAKCEPVHTTLLSPAAAALVLGDDAAPAAQYLVVRFEGAPEAVDVQLRRAESAIDPFAQLVVRLSADVESKLLEELRDFSLFEYPLSAEFHILSSQVGAYARMLEWTASRAGFVARVAAECRTGILHVHVEPAPGEQSGRADWLGLLPDWTDKAQRVGGSFTTLRMPDAWRNVGAPIRSPMLGELRLMREIKRRLDPGNIFNPGLLIDAGEHATE